MASVITPAEAREHLGGVTTGAVSDAKLQEWIDRAERAIERSCGPLVEAPKSARISAGAGGIPLTFYPVTVLVSVTLVGGSAIAIADLFVTDGGVVEWKAGGAFPAGRYDVQWKAGHGLTIDAVPDDLKLGVLERIRYFYETQRGSAGRVKGGQQPAPGQKADAFARSNELIEPFMMADF